MGEETAFANAQIYGEVAWLYGRSALHRNTPITLLERLVLPAILNSQYRLYRRGANPVAYVSWGFFSEEAERRFVRAPIRISPDDWKSGSRIWFIDFIAPFGDGTWLHRELRNNLFPDHSGRALRRYRSKEGLRIMYWHGRNALAKARDLSQNPTVALQD